MTKEEYNEAAALVVRLRKELEHTNQHLVAHIDALTKSNAQCGEYLRHNEMLAADRATLHKELVEVRAALAATTEQRDSLQRTLDEWSNADTEPHDRVTAEDVADHVVPPVCFDCGSRLVEVGGLVFLCRSADCMKRLPTGAP